MYICIYKYIYVYLYIYRDVLVQLPPDEALDEALGRQDPEGTAACGGSCELPKDLQW